MTVAVEHNNLPNAPQNAPATPPSKLRRRPGNPWRRLWQIPLLIAGGTLFVVGLRTLVHSIHRTPFSEHIKGVQSLIDAGQYDKAIDQINVLFDYFKATDEQAQLQKLAGDADFLAEQQLETGKEPVMVRKNYQSTLDHYRRAVVCGMQPTALTDERWGLSALALGDHELAEEKFEAAIAGDADAAVLNRHARQLITAYLEDQKNDKAMAIVDRMLEKPGAMDDPEAVEQQAWALCKKIEIALLPPVERPSVVSLKKETAPKEPDLRGMVAAIAVARAALEHLPAGEIGRDARGRVLEWIARAEWQAGDANAAETDLKAARAVFTVHHLDDGRAALLLGKIAEARSDFDGAAVLFHDIILGQTGTTIWAAARLGRAETRVARGMPLDDEILGDYRFAIAAVNAAAVPEKELDRQNKLPPRPAEFLSRPDLRASLQQAFRRASEGERLTDALAFLSLEEDLAAGSGGGLDDRESPDLVLQLATTRERWANQLMAESARLAGPARQSAAAKSREVMTQSAADYLHHADMTTLEDDISGNSLWKAGELYDDAGQTMHAIEVFERFTSTRPRDARVSEGLLALGRLYESAGMIDQALEVYRRNVKENPRTPASYTSAVNAARCLMTLGDRAAKPADKDKAYADAEDGLLAILQNNSDIRPSAREFRDSLLQLGELYYRTQRWADAILRLDEALRRYGTEETWDGMPRALFLLAESYRKSAIDIQIALNPELAASANPASQPADAAKAPATMPEATLQRAELSKARLERLTLAADYFTHVIALLDTQDLDDAAARIRDAAAADPDSRPSGAERSLEATYLRTSYMDRAACYFDRGEYQEAIGLYDRAAARFSEESLALQAYVQIVNAYNAMKQPAEAAAAAERGRWLLSRMPETAFARSATGADRAYYEKLLALGKP